MDAPRDENFVTVLLGVSSVDGVTPVPLQVDPVTGRLLVDVEGGEGSGDVVGPGSAVDDNIAVFDGTTGKLIKDGGTTIAALQSDIDDRLVITQNLADLDDAATARSNLGVEIGVDVQAYNANLTTWAGKTAPSGTVVGTTDTQTLTNKDLSSTTNTFATASTTQKGPVELATSAEIDTGTDSTRAMSVDQFVASKRNVRRVLYRVLAGDTAHEVATRVGYDLVLPFSGTIISVGATVDTAGVTGSGTYDINKNGSTIMAVTKITIETGEKSSRDATTQPVLTTTAVAAGDILTFDVDAIQTTPAEGLTFFIDIRE